MGAGCVCALSFGPFQQESDPSWLLISGQKSAKRQPLSSSSKLPSSGPRQQQIRTVPAGRFEPPPAALSGPGTPADSRIPAALVPGGSRAGQVPTRRRSGWCAHDARGYRWRPASNVGGGIKDEDGALGARPKPGAASMLEPQ